MEHFSFLHTANYDDQSQENYREVETDYIVDVLRAFRDFLVSAGFEFVKEVEVDCGDVIWSSEDVE